MKKIMQLTKMVLALLLIVGPTWAVAQAGQEDYHAQIASFFAKIKAGKNNEAIDFLYKDNPWMGKKVDAIQNLKNQLGNLDNLVGRYLSHELILEKKVANRFAYLYYFVAYERQPLQFIFEYYKPQDKWIVFSFSFNTKIDEEIEKKAEQELFLKSH